MQEIALTIKDLIPKGYTMFLFVAPSSAVKFSDERATYISNMHREDAINCMKEFMIKCGAAEDWMKHIK